MVGGFHYSADNRVEAGAIAPASQNSDAFYFFHSSTFNQYRPI
jgi:hypothetical protein